MSKTTRWISLQSIAAGAIISERSVELNQIWQRQPLERRNVDECDCRDQERRHACCAHQPPRTKQALGPLRDRAASERKPQVEREQTSEKGEGDDIFDAVFHQEDGDEEGGNHRIEDAGDRKRLAAIALERPPVE